jgi:hypothetical protein
LNSNTDALLRDWFAATSGCKSGSTEAWFTSVVLLELPEELGPWATLILPVVSKIPELNGNWGLVLAKVPTCEPLMALGLQLNLQLYSFTPSPAKYLLRKVSGRRPLACVVVMDWLYPVIMHRQVIKLISNLLNKLFMVIYD